MKDKPTPPYSFEELTCDTGEEGILEILTRLGHVGAWSVLEHLNKIIEYIVLGGPRDSERVQPHPLSNAQIDIVLGTLYSHLVEASDAWQEELDRYAETIDEPQGCGDGVSDLPTLAVE